MKVHNTLQHGLIATAARRALGDTGTEGGVERYSETLDVVMDLWQLPEWRYLRRERTGVLGYTEGVGAGRSRLGIQNLTTTDLVVVEEVQNRGAAGSFIPYLGFGFTVDSAELFRPTDTRFYTPNAGACTTTGTHRQGALGGTSTGLGSLYLPVGELIKLNVVLGPGWSLSFDPSVDATAIGLWVRIRERAASRGEL